MNTHIEIISSCIGSFTINKYGIYSSDDILLDSFNYENGLIQIIGKLKDVNYIEEDSFAIGLFPNDEDEITVNGIKYAKGKNEETQSFSYSWNDIGIYNPILNSIKIIGVGQFKIDIPLNNKCKIIGNGYTSFIIANDNDKTLLNIKLKGNGDIFGKHNTELINKINLKINGFGKIHGFYIMDEFNYKVKGICHIDITKNINCKIIKDVTGIERII